MVRILSVGAALPDRVVSNAEIEARLGQPPGWIEERTGIRARRAAANGQLAYHLGAAAGRQALERAGLTADQVDAIVFSTMFCDYVLPGSGVLVQRELGVRRAVPAFDLRDQCAGFLYALSLADALVRARRARFVLVVCAERQHENFLDYEPTAPVFGDAGSAVVIGPAEAAGRGVLAVDVGADGRGAEMAIAGCDNVDVFAPENRDQPELERALAEAARQPPLGRKMYYWSGADIFRAAVATMVRSSRAILARAGATVSDVDWFLFHQANVHINQAVVRRLGLDPARCPGNIERFGNTTSASIPLLLAELEADGRLQPGQLCLFATFGAGYAWGAAAVRW
jgi:3-oxoacyl-[acyl-carrier-protein] synthase-3